ncbi:MAG: FAD:protein FMN transferase [Nanoarchaeota archaeon]|nr:FAD:protein FMN transferase [Nanoarchaeota archaeon]MBU1004996.1 FAD:protein FMN transferase [Nanoarchaeota archaeon]MBU1945888.1 FAD:protein FMN transferase [Nanoarchaeota archaeon]
MKQIFFVILLAFLVTSCTTPLQKTEQTRELMSTYFTITAYDKNPQKAEQAIDSAFDEIARIESILSIYQNTAQAYLLNKQGYIDNAVPELIETINKSIYYGELSDGAFEITVQPVLDLYTYSFTELKRPPTDQEISSAVKEIGYKNILIKGNHIEFTKPNMKITLGGIAKGYAVEKAINVLKQNGINHALVNAGGNMRAIGNKENEKWSIALRNPRDENDYITIVYLDNNAVSTSGDYERYFDENKTFHHIINPTTGYSATDLISVTIVTDNAYDADALSTSVFVLGPEKGLELIEKLDNAEGLLITKDKKIIKSSGWK